MQIRVGTITPPQDLVCISLVKNQRVKWAGAFSCHGDETCRQSGGLLDIIKDMQPGSPDCRAGDSLCSSGTSCDLGSPTLERWGGG